jgi:CPA2 family monovalent cation:H+ antiporter-2
MGPPDGLKDAERVLNEVETSNAQEDRDRFEIAEVMVADDSKLSGRTLAELRFRQTYGVNLIGIMRGKDKITSISPAEQVVAGDRLVVIGTSGAVGNLKTQEPL